MANGVWKKNGHDIMMISNRSVDACETMHQLDFNLGFLLTIKNGIIYQYNGINNLPTDPTGGLLPQCPESLTTRMQDLSSQSHNRH